MSTLSTGAPLPPHPPPPPAPGHGDGPLAVLAGAGTGKTRVLTRRVTRLVQQGVPPWEILAVTFTNKAAQEMRERLSALLEDAAATVWVGTFHAVCARFLRRYGAYVGLRPGWGIYDEADQEKVVGRILRDAGLHERATARQVLARVGRAKDRGQDPAALSGHPTDDVVHQVWPAYRDRLAVDNAVDFSDLLLKVLDLWGAPPAADQLDRKFTHVLVDEFQDTNAVQFEIAKRLSSRTRNLTVVGDDDQAIYAWRGAEPANLLYFERDFPDACVVKLEQNYRSTPVVLTIANTVIRKNAARHDKTLWTDQRGGDPAVVHQADDDTGEAAYVADKVAGLLAQGVAPRDVAILYRTNQQSRLLEEFLRGAAVTARVVGGVSFFDRKEVRDALAYVRLVVDEAADAAFERAVAAPPRGVGDVALGKLRVAARGASVSLLTAARQAGAGGHSVVLAVAQRKKLGMFAAVVDQLRAAVDAGASVSQLVSLVVEWSGLRAKLEEDRSQEGRERVGHLSQLVSCATDFDDRCCGMTSRSGRVALPEGVEPWDVDLHAPGSLALTGAPGAPGGGSTRVCDFLERLALSGVGEESPPVPEDDQGAVQLMTIHVAKGLEWPVVFVTGLEDGLFPSLREREEVDPADALEEERRLFYVAVTRARSRLFLTHARTRRVWGEVRPCDPSRFLDELPR